MHTAFLFHSRLEKHGSEEDLILALARSVARRGDRSTFIFPACGVPALQRSLAALAEVRFVDGPWTSLGAVRAIGRWLARDPPDVLNSHHCDALPFAALHLWARLRGMRVVPHYHGEILPFHELPPWRRWNALRASMLPAHAIIAVSHANARYLAHHGVNRPVSVIHHGIDLARFVPRTVQSGALAPWGLDGERYLISVGSLSARRRVDVLLEAFALVRRVAPTLKLILVGGGDLAVHRRMATSLDLDGAVRFEGMVAELPLPLLCRAELLVSASEQESFGLAYAEALALGVPVVACHVGGVPEVVRDGEVGLLAVPGDAGDLADKILRLVGDRALRDRLAARGRRRIAERFNLDEKVELILERLGHAPAEAARPIPERALAVAP